MIIKGTEDGSGVAGVAITTTILGVLFGGLALSYKKFDLKTLTGEATEADKLRIAKVKNLVTNVTLVSTMLMLYYFGNENKTKPAAVIAGVPIGTAEELSHALSDRELRYRATGGVFLAHQGGGNESLRIVCKAFGKNRYLFLTLIDFLFLYGSARIVDLFSGAMFTRLSRDSATKVGGFAASLKPNPWKDFKSWSVDEGREEYHLTFPIVTKTRIYTSMYIETYDIIESVENGMNMLTVSLFFRKWVPPYPYEFVKRKEGIDKEDSVWYREQTNDLATKTLRFIDAVLDFGLSVVIQMHRLYSELELSAYNSEQMLALTFATRLDKAGPVAYNREGNKTLVTGQKEVDNSELTGFNPGNLNFVQTLMGLF